MSTILTLMKMESKVQKKLQVFYTRCTRPQNHCIAIQLALDLVMAWILQDNSKQARTFLLQLNSAISQMTLDSDAMFSVKAWCPNVNAEQATECSLIPMYMEELQFCICCMSMYSFVIDMDWENAQNELSQLMSLHQFHIQNQPEILLIAGYIALMLRNYRLSERYLTEYIDHAGVIE